MDASILALKVSVELSQALTQALEMTLPEQYKRIKDIRDYCDNLYESSLIKQGCGKDCCS
jgi:hypothetical protein